MSQCDCCKQESDKLQEIGSGALVSNACPDCFDAYGAQPAPTPSPEVDEGGE